MGSRWIFEDLRGQREGISSRILVSANLGCGLGLLLLLFVGATLVSFWQRGLVEDRVREITNVDGPKSMTALEVEINAIRTGEAEMNYLETGDPAMRVLVEETEVEHRRLENQYLRAANIQP